MIRRAGGLVPGSGAVLRSVRSGRASLVLVSEDSGEVAVRRFTRECEKWRVPLVRVGNQADFGRVLGRRAVSVIAITDRSFAAAFLAKLGISELQVPGYGNGDRQGGS